jgi:hypothetical protein
VAEDAVEGKGLALEGDIGAAREHHLDAIASADIFLGAADGGFEAGLADVRLADGEASGIR